MVSEYIHRRRVEFPDTDMAGIMHFSRFFVYMESTEHAFFRSLGFSVVTNINGENYGWPRIEANCSYKNPIKFEDEIDIHLRIREINDKTIFYEFQFYKVTETERIEIATGTLKTICVSMDKKTHKMKAVSIPSEIREKIEAIPKNE
jgi:acyl-CoA thioester hydrolase